MRLNARQEAGKRYRYEIDLGGAGRQDQGEREGFVSEALPPAAPAYRLRCRRVHCRLWCHARQPCRTGRAWRNWHTRQIWDLLAVDLPQPLTGGQEGGRTSSSLVART